MIRPRSEISGIISGLKFEKSKKVPAKSETVQKFLHRSDWCRNRSGSGRTGNPAIWSLISVGAWPNQQNRKSALLRPRIRFLFQDYYPQTPSGISMDFPKRREKRW